MVVFRKEGEIEDSGIDPVILWIVLGLVRVVLYLHNWIAKI